MLQTRLSSADTTPVVPERAQTGEAATIKLQTQQLNFFYGNYQALHDINLNLKQQGVTAFIGPSGCGKSTLLRVFNRIYALYPGQRAEGRILLDGDNILDDKQDLIRLRARVGMVFQKPTPFPMSIFDNVAYGIRLYEKLPRGKLEERVEQALRQSALWEEVKDKLKQSGMQLSGGQQQRLCIARALAVNPEILLLDEPASALDPISTLKIEELISDIKDKVTVLIVTHNMQQAARVSDDTVFMSDGKVVEMAATKTLFTTPANKQTEDYITGRYG